MVLDQQTGITARQQWVGDKQLHFQILTYIHAHTGGGHVVLDQQTGITARHQWIGGGMQASAVHSPLLQQQQQRPNQQQGLHMQQHKQQIPQRPPLPPSLTPQTTAHPFSSLPASTPTSIPTPTTQQPHTQPHKHNTAFATSPVRQMLLTPRGMSEGSGNRNSVSGVERQGIDDEYTDVDLGQEGREGGLCHMPHTVQTTHAAHTTAHTAQHNNTRGQGAAHREQLLAQQGSGGGVSGGLIGLQGSSSNVVSGLQGERGVPIGSAGMGSAQGERERGLGAEGLWECEGDGDDFVVVSSPGSPQAGTFQRGECVTAIPILIVAVCELLICSAWPALMKQLTCKKK